LCRQSSARWSTSNHQIILLDLEQQPLCCVTQNRVRVNKLVTDSTKQQPSTMATPVTCTRLLTSSITFTPFWLAWFSSFHRLSNVFIWKWSVIGHLSHPSFFMITFSRFLRCFKGRFKVALRKASVDRYLIKDYIFKVYFKNV